MSVEIYCNEVAGGWLPSDLEKSLGGSEEVIVLFARELKRTGRTVTVYHNRPSGYPDPIEYEGVTFLPRQSFKYLEPHDTLITWKDSNPWKMGVSANKAVHWSSDVEPPWSYGTFKKIDYFVCLTDFHKSFLPWLPEGRGIKVIPHGIDTKFLDENRLPKSIHSILYSSSPDRGLQELLLDWPKIQANGEFSARLNVTYGWGLFDRVSEGNPHAVKYKAELQNLLEQTGVFSSGELPACEMATEYWANKYWVLPLQKPGSELFCLNAVKARYCGMIPVVNRIGALRNTVGDHIPYDQFVNGSREITHPPLDGIVEPLDWKEVVEKYWEPILA